MQLPGTVSISKVFGGGEPPVIRIAIEDKASGITFVEATLDLAAFAAAVTGSADQPCTLEVRGLDKLGYTFEWKEEKLIIPTVAHLSREQLESIAREQAPRLEIDGWHVTEQSLKRITHFNNKLHRAPSGYHILLTLHRYLPPTIKE